MQTYSHLLVTAALVKPAQALVKRYPDRLPSVHVKAFLLGGVLPDLLLILLSIWAIGDDWRRGVFTSAEFANAPPGTPPSPELLELSTTMRLFDVWFYEHPGVIALQNLFHSPLLLVLFWAMGTWLWRRRGQTWLFWLMAACLIHTLIDIPLHVDDGPLLLFPLNWQWRFESAVSYWDPAYHGRVWGRFEHALDLVLLIWLAVAYRHELRRWLRRMFGRRTAL